MSESARGEQRDFSKRGFNTEIRLTFLRHSQKASGRVFAGAGISASGISEPGQARARQFGEEQLASREVDKSYATTVNRTRETLEQAFQGAEIDTKILQDGGDLHAYFALPAQKGSPEYNKRYEKIMAPGRETYIAEHFPGKQFDELTTDEQEQVAEYAEEPAMEWYLSFDTERPDTNTASPREDAARVAAKINRLVNLPDFMPENKSADLVSSGHKTSTEAFLKYVIQRTIDGETVTGFNRLEDIGGSLKIMDSWDLDVKNDEKGEKKITITLRRENGDTQTFGIDLDALRELAAEGREQADIQTKKIDAL